MACKTSFNFEYTYGEYGDLLSIRKLWDAIEKNGNCALDTVSYDAMMTSLISNGEYELCLHFFDEMQERDLFIDETTFVLHRGIRFANKR